MKQRSQEPPTMLRKSFLGIEFKADAEKQGSFRAIIARFDTGPDKQGDVYTGPDAFPIGKAVVISAYGHASWYGALPVGDGVVGADEKAAWIDGQFLLDTSAGKDHYLVAKRLADLGLGDWSYGYDALDFSVNPKDLAGYGDGALRLLKQLDVFEGSMVLIGAGNATGIDSIKSAIDEHIQRVIGQVEELQGRLKTRADLRAKEGRTLSSASRDRIASAIGALQELLDSTEPDPAEAESADEGKTAVDIEELRSIQMRLEKSRFDRIAV